MKLVRAEGNVRMQQALAHSYVRTIVDILLQHRDTLGFVAEVLQTFTRPDESGLARMLAGIRTAYSQLDAEGNTVIPIYIASLTETLEKLYRQNIEKIGDQRGAIVELFVRKLVCPRYDNDQQCANSRRFEDDRGRLITTQEVDVAALSHDRRHIEGYECKLKATGLTSDDCIDLAFLLKSAQEAGYRANVGVVSFDSDRTVKRRLRHLQAVIEHLASVRSIKAYGLESVELLRNDPFE
jgi:hypothetical protein